MSVITMGGLAGGGSRLLGPMVAEKLEADYVDRLILGTAARHLGATVEALHQREERLPTRGERFSAMLQRILERSAQSGASGDPYFGPGGMAFLTQDYEELPQPTITQGHELEDEKYIETMRHVMTELAAEGNVVIVGRGGSIILRDQPNVLRVDTVAWFADRVSRIAEREKLDREQAEKVVIARDEARTYYFQRYFGIDNPNAAELYHLTINTSDVDPEYATELIVHAYRAMEQGKLPPKVGAAA